jgi:hypothetical protein
VGWAVNSKAMLEWCVHNMDGHMMVFTWTSLAAVPHTPRLQHSGTCTELGSAMAVPQQHASLVMCGSSSTCVRDGDAAANGGELAACTAEQQGPRPGEQEAIEAMEAEVDAAGSGDPALGHAPAAAAAAGDSERCAHP